MQNPNILPSAPAPGTPELIRPALSPAAVIAEHAPTARSAAAVGLNNVMGGLVGMVPLAGFGFLTWLGADMILGGILGNPFTPQSAKRSGRAS